MTHTCQRTVSFVSELSSLLQTSSIGCTVRALESVTSTNTVASEWAAAGGPHGAVVYAETQTEGRGRQGRVWKTEPGLNLTFSVILRPEVPADRFGLIIIAASVALAEVLRGETMPVEPFIKWPNDILFKGKKCCGMLLETGRSARGAEAPDHDADSRQAVVLGIGVNVNQDTFPDDLSDRATSLLLETGRIIPRAPLMADICRRLEQRLADARTNPREIRRHYMARMSNLGEPIRLRFSGTQGGIRGVALGLDDAGGLILETDVGRQVFHAGEVTTSA